MSVVCSWSNFKNVVCGERHRNQIEIYDAIFAKLIAIGCKLVFYTDLNVQPEKVSTWLKRRQDEITYYTSLYDYIESGLTLDQIVAQMKEQKAMPAVFYSIQMVAWKYGEFRQCHVHECDLEVARYATENDALAVISNDTDFLIYEGGWRFWNVDDISTALNATEFDRFGIARLLALSAEQRPLFATLIGNDFTNHNEIFKDLSQFHSSLGDWKRKFYNVADFVRKLQRNRLTTDDMKLIARRVFGDENMHTLLKESIDSYSLSYAIAPLDPIAAKMAGNPMQTCYLELNGLIQTINLPFCDLRGSTGNLTMVLLDCLKRTIGVLRQHKNDESFTFTILIRKCVKELYYAPITEKPIYPHCKYDV